MKKRRAKNPGRRVPNGEIWTPTPTEESVERFKALPEVAALGLTDAEARDAAARLLGIHYLMNVYRGTWRPEPPSGIAPAPEDDGPQGLREGDDPDPDADGHRCGTR